MNKKFIILLPVVFLLAGCAAAKPQTTYNMPSYLHNDSAQIKLSEAAVSVSQSLNQLAQIEQATHPHARLPPPPNPAQIGMAQLASVDWTGPIQPLIAKIAEATGYQFRVLGRSPAIPIVVALQTRNVPIAEILRDAKFQAGFKTNIAVYPQRKIIELRYSS